MNPEVVADENGSLWSRVSYVESLVVDRGREGRVTNHRKNSIGNRALGVRNPRRDTPRRNSVAQIR